MPIRLTFPVVKVVLASLAVGLMSGCSGSFAPGPIQLNRTQIGNIQGAVHGGQAPVTGAHIYLYAAGTGGYGTNATSLISSTAPNAFEDGDGNYYVVTDGNGNFALGGDYTCTEGTQVYMVAVGGNRSASALLSKSTILSETGGCRSEWKKSPSEYPSAFALSGIVDVIAIVDIAASAIPPR